MPQTQTELFSPVTGRPTHTLALQDLAVLCDVAAEQADVLVRQGGDPTKQFVLALAARGLLDEDVSGEEPAVIEVRWARTFERAVAWASALRSGFHFASTATELRAIAAVARVTAGGVQ